MPTPSSEVNEKIYDHRVLTDWSTINATNGSVHLSKDMVFNDGHRLSIIVYSILFVISTIGNSTVLYLLTKRRLRGPSRIDIMLMHLAIADLLVTFLLMPLEIAWAYTVQWRSTDFVCRLMSIFRVFGLYLSSFVVVCISLDRYYAIMMPLKLSNNRGRIMLACAWIGSVICSLPQAFLFHLERHPTVADYFQCVTFHSFASEEHKLVYQIANMCAMYAWPLITFIYCYGAIYLEIYRKSKRILKGVERFRRSNDDVLGRAKKRTLRMTIIIVLVFIICWTPYYIICMWYWLDKSSVDKVSSLVRKGLFLFASTNSCMNPIVYGLFNVRGRLGNNSNVHNRHTSLTYRLDSSTKLQRSIGGATGGTTINSSNTNGKIVGIRGRTSTMTTVNGVNGIAGSEDGGGPRHLPTIAHLAAQSTMLAVDKTLNEQEKQKIPIICIDCHESVELVDVQKQ